MKILEKIKAINNKAIFSSTAFLTMGITASFFASSPVALLGLSTSPIILTFLIFEVINKYRIKKVEDGFTNQSINSSIIPQIYKKLFTKELDKYIDESKTILEKKYKLIFTSFAFNKLGINPDDIIYKPYDKSYKGIKDYNIERTDGIMVDIFNNYYFHLDYEKLIEEDIKDSEKLKVIQKVYKDFEYLGILGKEVSRLFGLDPNFKLILTIQNYKLNEADLIEIEKVTQKIINTETLHRYLSQKARDKQEQNFIFDIINNNHKHIKILHKFHTEMHCHNNSCSDPELIDYVDKLLNTLNLEKKISNHLPEKVNTKTKVKKI